MMNDQIREIDTIDVIMWFTRYWILAGVVILAVVSLTAFMYWLQVSQPPFFQTTFSIYSGGTPVRNSAEISSILSSQIKDAEIRESGTLVVVSSRSAAEALVVEAKAEALAKELLDEVAIFRDISLPYRETNEAAFQNYLVAEVFLNTASAGTFKVINAETYVVQPTKSLRTVLMPLIAGVFLFFAIALTHSIWQFVSKKASVRAN